MAAPKALIADPDALARNALREALAVQGATVVGQAADEAQLLNLVSRCKPDVVVMDERLPPRGALAALEALLLALPSVQVVLLAETVFANLLKFAAMQAGEVAGGPSLPAARRRAGPGAPRCVRMARPTRTSTPTAESRCRAAAA